LRAFEALSTDIKELFGVNFYFFVLLPWSFDCFIAIIPAFLLFS